jgi:hypothetical protein
MKKLTVLIPTVNRRRALAVTGFRFQNYRNYGP